MHVLVFELPASSELERIHGREVTDIVGRNFTASFAELARQLLVYHERLSPVLNPEFGLWMIPFEMGDLEIEVEPEEQCESITAAGREMVRRMLQEQLGMAVAVRTEFRLAVFETDVTTTDSELIRMMLRRKLGSTIPTAFVEPKITREAFMEVIHGGKIEVHLQPIVRLRDLKTVGFEALARGPRGSEVRNAGDLFGAAAYFGVDMELDLACVAAALEWAPRVPKDLFLTINMSPELITQSTLHRLIEEQDDSALVRRQVLEITEHLPIDSSLKVHQALAPFRRLGARIALDDAGCGFFNMDMVRALTPDIVKICITVVKRVARYPAVEAMVRELVSKCAEVGAVTLGEGIEEKAQAELLKDCGVMYGQGFLFAKPRPASEVIPELKG